MVQSQLAEQTATWAIRAAAVEACGCVVPEVECWAGTAMPAIVRHAGSSLLLRRAGRLGKEGDPGEITPVADCPEPCRVIKIRWSRSMTLGLKAREQLQQQRRW
jgi:hypothetical protein